MSSLSTSYHLCYLYNFQRIVQQRSHPLRRVRTQHLMFFFLVLSQKTECMDSILVYLYRCYSCHWLSISTVSDFFILEKWLFHFQLINVWLQREAMGICYIWRLFTLNVCFFLILLLQNYLKSFNLELKMLRQTQISVVQSFQNVFAVSKET